MLTKRMGRGIPVLAIREGVGRRFLATNPSDFSVSAGPRNIGPTTRRVKREDKAMGPLERTKGFVFPYFMMSRYPQQSYCPFSSERRAANTSSTHSSAILFEGSSQAATRQRTKMTVQTSSKCPSPPRTSTMRALRGQTVLHKGKGLRKAAENSGLLAREEQRRSDNAIEKSEGPRK